jgi:hypothetical protein
MKKKNRILQFWRHFVTSWISIIALVIVSLPVLPQAEVHASATCDTSDPEVKARKDACTEGQTFRTEKCSCETSPAAERFRRVVMECQEVEDPTERRVCQENLAKDSSGNPFVDQTAMDIVGSIGNTVAGINLGAAVISMIASEPTAGSCPSRTLMTLSSVAAIGAEIFTFFFMENGVRDLQKDYHENYACDNKSDDEEYTEGCQATNPDSFEAQMQAFEYLRKEQDLIAKVAEAKMIAFIIASIAYTATWIAAGMELAGVAGLVACSITTYQRPDFMETMHLPAAFASNTNQNDQVDLKFLKKLLNFVFPNAHALSEEASDRIGSGTGAGGLEKNTTGYDSDKGEATGSLLNSDKGNSVFRTYRVMIMGGIGAAAGLIGGMIPYVKGFLRSSLGILIIGIVCMLLYITLSVVAGIQMTQAKENSAKVEEVRLLLEGIGGTFCSNGREDIADPKCYCFLQGGGRNPDRQNSQTCQSLFASLDGFAPPEPEPVNQFGGDNIIGCMTMNRQFDQECQCKKFKDKKTGQNACYQVPIASTQLGSLGNSLGVSDALKNLGDLTNGNLNNNLNADELGNRAKKMQRNGRELLNKANKKLLSEGKKGIPPITGALVDSILQNTIPKEDLNRLASGASQASEIGQPTNPALQKAIEEVKKANKTTLSGGGGWTKKAEEKKSDFDFSLDDKGSAGATTGELGFMEKKYNFKDNDIVKNENANIWQIITNRYNQSGYLRLFDDEK